MERDYQSILDILKSHLKLLSPSHPFGEVYEYSLFPPGKLFRPILCAQMAKDLGWKDPYLDKNLQYYLSALELHHAYTLIHDDLPSMDDDDYRRGKLSTHKKFGEWKAVLAGDALLNISLGLLFKIDHQNMATIGKIFSWATGSKGLIHGQVLDLSEEGQTDFDALLLTHELKTARLIQLALIGPTLLLGPDKFSVKKCKQAWRLGEDAGLLFQFLDDLCELTEKDISTHEIAINPWVNHPEKCVEKVNFHLSRLSRITAELELSHSKDMLLDYLSKIEKKVSQQKSQVENHLRNPEYLNKVLPLKI